MEWIGWVLAIMAFFQMMNLRNRMRRMERQREEESGIISPERADLKAAMARYVGQEIRLEFYEDEEVVDLISPGKYGKTILEDVDEKWALVRLETPKKTVRKLVRLSSIRGVTA